MTLPNGRKTTMPVEPGYVYLLVEREFIKTKEPIAYS